MNIRVSACQSTPALIALQAGLVRLPAQKSRAHKARKAFLSCSVRRKDQISMNNSPMIHRMGKIREHTRMQQ